MKFLPISHSILLLALSQPLAAVTLLVDDFSEGDLALSLGGTTSGNSTVVGEFGTLRSARIRARNSVPGTTLTSTFLGSNGYSTFALDEAGLTASIPPPGLHLAYGGAGTRSLLGSSGFEFDFRNVQGAGFLLIEVGGETVKTSSSLRVPLIGPGTLRVPLDMVNLGTGGSLDAFSALHFDFHAQTTEFSFTLDQIRVVPEPSVLLLLSALSLTVFTRRRRVG